MTLKPRWFSDAPAERLAALRILIGSYALVYVIARAPELIAVARLPASHFAPTGVTRVLDAPLPEGVAIALVLAAIGSLAAFVAGAAYRITGPIAAVLLLWVLSYRNAWGMVFHTENLLVLHVLALALAPAADAWSIDARSSRAAPPDRASSIDARRGRRLPGPAASYGWAIQLMIALTAATYVLAAVAKLRLAGLGWIDGELLRNQIAVDNLRKALLGDLIAPLALPFLDHPSWFTAFCALTLAVELAAPIALLGGRPARMWALGAWGFHVGVVLLMNIWFPYPLFGLAFLPVLRPERLIAWLIGRWRGRRSRRP